MGGLAAEDQDHQVKEFHGGGSSDQEMPPLKDGAEENVQQKRY